MDYSQIGQTDWRRGKWGLVAASVTQALDDVKACTADLRTSLMVLSMHKDGLHNVSCALDKLELYQRILVNTLEAERVVPELLEALKELDEAYCSVGPDMSRAERHQHRLVLMKARAAIAKASPSTTADAGVVG